MNDNSNYGQGAGPAGQGAANGIDRAVAHADRVEAKWSQRAFELLEGYALFNFEFMTEDVRVWATEQGLPTPPDGRAWGAVTLRAVRDKIIVRDRFQRTRVPPAHSTFRPVWRSQLYQEAA
jgi:hypothetical protein